MNEVATFFSFLAAAVVVFGAGWKAHAFYHDRKHENLSQKVVNLSGQNARLSAQLLEVQKEKQALQRKEENSQKDQKGWTESF